MLCYGKVNSPATSFPPAINNLQEGKAMEDMPRFKSSFNSPQEINFRQIRIIGEFIHALRTNRQMGIMDCAETLGIDYQTIDNIERGNTKKIHTAFIINFIKLIQQEAGHG